MSSVALFEDCFLPQHFQDGSLSLALSFCIDTSQPPAFNPLLLLPYIIFLIIYIPLDILAMTYGLMTPKLCLHADLAPES